VPSRTGVARLPSRRGRCPRVQRRRVVPLLDHSAANHIPKAGLRYGVAGGDVSLLLTRQFGLDVFTASTCLPPRCGGTPPRRCTLEPFFATKARRIPLRTRRDLGISNPRARRFCSSSCLCVLVIDPRCALRWIRDRLNMYLCGETAVCMRARTHSLRGRLVPGRGSVTICPMPVAFTVAGRSYSGSGFLFDKDGTLLSYDHWLAVMEERARRIALRLTLTEAARVALLQFMGLDPEHPVAANQGILPLPRTDAEMATSAYLASALGNDRDEMQDLTVSVFQEVDEEFPFDRLLRPTAGAEEGLRAIQRAGGRTAVVTHDTTAAATRHLAALGWTELVDIVIGIDACAERKPAPTPVLVACRDLGLRPAETVMVGDMASDLLSGRAAGCRLTVGVLTGLGTEEELAPLADVVVPDLTALSLD